MTDRSSARALAAEHLQTGDPTGWFEPLYAAAAGDPGAVPWADRVVNPGLASWAGLSAAGRALVVGCGLGDDAAWLAARGLDVTAFDLSPTAIDWARRRFPDAGVDWRVADALEPPPTWAGRFDLVVEIYTLQVLPPAPRARALASLRRLATPGGRILVLCRGRTPGEPEGELPWPLTADELNAALGAPETFEAWRDDEDPPVRRFRGCWRIG